MMKIAYSSIFLTVSMLLTSTAKAQSVFDLVGTRPAAEEGCPDVITWNSLGDGDTFGKIAPGTAMVADLRSGLNVKKVKVGDTVTAVVNHHVICGGKKVIPKGSKLIGHITEASQLDNQHPESRMGVVFDRIEVKHGNSTLFTGELQAVAARMDGFEDKTDYACINQHSSSGYSFTDTCARGPGPKEVFV